MAQRRKARTDSQLLRSLNRNVVRLASRLEADNVAAFVALSQRPLRMMWVNLLAGLARGVGIFLGAGVMGAMALALVTGLTYYVLEISDMIPVVSDFVRSIQGFLGDFVSRHRPD